MLDVASSQCESDCAAACNYGSWQRWFRLWGIVTVIFYCSSVLPSVSTKALAPKILQKIQGAEPTALARGKRFQVFCTATEGDLPLTFRWMKNAQSLASSSDIVVRRIDDYSSNLFIESVTEYHSGNYSCVVSNAAGMDSYTVSLQVNVPPYWVHQPIDSSSIFGGDIQIPCEAGGNPSPKVVWKKSKDMLSHTIQDVSDTGRFRVNSVGTLTISRSQKEDSGFYTCEISNGVGQGLRKTAKVDVYVPPQMGEKFRLLTERKGQSVHLTCDVIGDLPLKIEWRKGDRLLNPQTDTKQSEVEKENSSGISSIFEISNVEAEDSGLYRCLAENSRGRGETQTRVVIVAALAPKILHKNRNQDVKLEVSKGHRFHEVCTVSYGDIPLAFRWLKNGQTLSTSVDTTIRRMDDYSSSLIIESVSEYSSGNYTCVVSNAAGMDRHNFYLQVNVPPYWTRQPTDVSVLAGDEVVLQCQGGGSPATKTTWKRSNNILTEISHDVKPSSMIRVGEDGSLSIIKAREDEEGFYTCFVNNGVGDGLRKTVKVEVLVPPQASEEFKIISQKKGTSVELYCNVTGDLPLQISWMKDFEEFKTSPNDRMSITQTDIARSVTSVLKIDSSTTSDSGTYTCSGQNSHGRGDTRFRLTIIEPPGKVLKVTLLNIWSRSARLSWNVSYNGNSPITNILVEIKPASDDSGEKIQQSIKPNEPSTVLEELAPGTSYYLWVQAENEVGVGEASDRLYFTTMQEEPSHAPVNFKVDSVRARSARFSWEAMKKEHWNGIPLGYYLGFMESRNSGQFAFITILNRQLRNETVKTYLLTGLERSTDYTVVLRAFNSAGIGPLTDAVKIRTKTGVPPNTPTIKIMSSKSNDVDFAIYQESQDDEVESYICHIKRHPGNWEEAPLVVSQRGRYTIGGLIGDHKYQAFVTAKNTFGVSEPSEEVAFKTSPEDPFVFGDEESDSLMERTFTFVLPTAISLFIIAVSFVTCCCVLCDCFCQKRLPKKQDGVAVRDFSYCAPASCSRSESGYYPPLQRASLPRGSVGSQSGLISANRSVYNEPRNYSPSTEDGEEPKYECVMEEMKTFLQPQCKTGSGSSKRSSKHAPVPT